MTGTYRRLKQQRAAGEIDEGFTLIELLIVIVVLGILAAVVVLALGGVTGNAAKSACQTDLQTINTAAAAYNAQNAAYPTTTAELTGGTSPFLQSWPSGTRYSVAFAATTSGTQVVLAVTNTATPAVVTDWTPGTNTPAQACTNVS